MQMERRRFETKEIHLRSVGGSKVIEGYAATFNAYAQLPGFQERLLPGCFDRALRESDPVCLFNHNADLVLGRYKNGTLRLTSDKHGLFFSCELPNTQAASDVHESIKRGDVNACSFALSPEILAKADRFLHKLADDRDDEARRRRRNLLLEA
jgi:hypothetical protein